MQSVIHAPQPPVGDITLMFTDIEGSTRGWDTYRNAYQGALDRHNELMRRAIALHDGFEVKTVGDSFMVAFSSASQAARCALEMQVRIEAETFGEIGSLRIRIGLHSGCLQPIRGDYFGPIVNHAARIENAAHGGQIVMSEETADLIRAEMPPDASLSDEGLHRLKDLGAPIRLFLLSSSDLPQREYPPLRTLNMTPHNFPAQVTSFVGREREQRELSKLIVNQKARLVTLTGPGGTGKTRLSMQVAAEAVQEFKDGIWLVELASLTDAREVPAALSLALKIPIVGETSIPAQVFEYLAEKTALLVIDNFEQVVDAARFIGDLLKNCRGISCMVTSQHLLQIAGEVEYPLSPLDVPAAGACLEECFANPTVQLFAERAQTARPAFTLSDENVSDVVEICRRLEGLPLAIELTAALVRALTPAQILPRLKDRYKLLASSRRDLDPRQHSLRGALDWSYELLNEEERIFFAEISVFSGGFCLEDAETICADCDAMLMSFALRDKSLLKTEEANEEARYLFLETLRGYAAEKLEQTGSADVIRERHALHFLERAKQWNAELNSSGAAMLRMIRDIDNLRAGMDWSIAQSKHEIVAAFGVAMGRFFLNRGLYDEGERRLASADHSARCIDDVRQLAQILLLRGRIAVQSGRHTDSWEFYKDSYTISDQLGDRTRMVMLLINMGGVSFKESDLPAADEYWTRGLELTRLAGQTNYEATLLSNLSMVAWKRGDHVSALAYIEDGLDIQRREKNRRSLAYTLLNYSEMLNDRGESTKALEQLQEARSICEEIGDRYGHTRAVIESGLCLIECGTDFADEANSTLNEGIRLSREIQDIEGEQEAAAGLAKLLYRRGERQKALDIFVATADSAMTCRNPLQMMRLVRLFAEFCQRDGHVAMYEELEHYLSDEKSVQQPEYYVPILTSICEKARERVSRA